MALNGRALAALSVGFVFLWSGVKGWSILGTLGDLITGIEPSQEVVNPVSIATAPTGVQTFGEAPSTGGGGGIVGIAMEYQGHAYVFASAPGRDGGRPWDCSSFVNYVVGVRMGRAIPGYGPGKYTGTVHGPPTGTWAVWPGLTRVSRSEVQGGDILVWVGHMGIAIDNSRMISALNPQEKTKVTAIQGGRLIMMGRLK